MQGRQLFHLLIIGGIGVMGLLFATIGYESTWGLWNIPTLSPHFADLRSITGGAESYVMGFDPMVENPGDPWGRQMNYPRIWQGLFLIGPDQSHTTALGLLFIGLFVVGLFLFVDNLTRRTAICLFAVIFSPAILLGIERANNDLFAFFLLATALALLSRSPVATMLLINVAGILKLFPYFGLWVLVHNDKRKSLWLCSISLVIAILYVGITWRDLGQIFEATQKGTAISYGINVVGMYLADWSHRPRVEPFLLIILACAVALLILPLTYYFASRSTYLNKCVDTPSLDAFKLGGAIYVGTFLLGNNFDYRLLFLLFTLQQLMMWTSDEVKLIRWTARIVLTSIIVSVWSLVIFEPLLTLPMGDDIAFVLDELANWLVFVGLLYLLMSSLPRWFWAEIERIGASSKNARPLQVTK